MFLAFLTLTAFVHQSVGQLTRDGLSSSVQQAIDSERDDEVRRERLRDEQWQVARVMQAEKELALNDSAAASRRAAEHAAWIGTPPGRRAAGRWSAPSTCVGAHPWNACPASLSLARAMPQLAGAASCITTEWGKDVQADEQSCSDGPPVDSVRPTDDHLAVQSHVTSLIPPLLWTPPGGSGEGALSSGRPPSLAASLGSRPLIFLGDVSATSVFIEARCLGEREAGNRSTAKATLAGGHPDAGDLALCGPPGWCLHHLPSPFLVELRHAGDGGTTVVLGRGNDDDDDDQALLLRLPLPSTVPRPLPSDATIVLSSSLHWTPTGLRRFGLPLFLSDRLDRKLSAELGPLPHTLSPPLSLSLSQDERRTLSLYAQVWRAIVSLALSPSHLLGARVLVMAASVGHTDCYRDKAALALGEHERDLLAGTRGGRANESSTASSRLVDELQAVSSATRPCAVHNPTFVHALNHITRRIIDMYGSSTIQFVDTTSMEECRDDGHPGSVGVTSSVKVLGVDGVGGAASSTSDCTTYCIGPHSVPAAELHDV
eukprot:CAMPEP_0170733296 /NCGR_PEP_ID=MMETSP0437-20130122/2003_1 /TAXON_ID=0 /ORGANISM="Sexangularia sp." /LENGTH=543 /DNA_ID=CAMNT_0011071577 /DNA_START=31 /DNA_END=1659 /DNA_ORIENTATION=+